MLESGSFQASVRPTSTRITSPAVISAVEMIRRNRCTRANHGGAAGGRGHACARRMRDFRLPMAAESPESPRIASYLADPDEVARVLLLYSGGLDTSVMV